MTLTTLYRAPGVTPDRSGTAARGDTRPMIDGYGRAITYVRLSVTDRCDLRCTYCMAEKMTFLPKRELLSLEELDRLAAAFIAKGMRKLRLTGGEPLVRRGIVDLIEDLGRHVKSGALDELTLTTNATQLESCAERLARAGVRRVNVSVDSLDPETFKRITRRGELKAVLDGIAAAQAAGLHVKLNAVALRQDNARQLCDMIAWAHARGMDFTVIEAMPMGDIDEDRFDQYIPLTEVREGLAKGWTLTPIPHQTGGPARYVRVEETGGRLGFITPLSHNFCEACNRVRVTCTGKMYMCLGQEDAADLAAPLRAHPRDDAPLYAAIDEAMARKPKGHDFVIDRPGAPPSVPRHMSVTGG
jgi:cyclic pyranopterin phosphate synthase